MNHMKLTTIIQPLFSKYYSIHEVKAKYQSRKGTQQVKNPPASAEDLRDMRLIPGLGRYWRHGNPLQYYCLENPLDKGAWPAIVP